MEVPCSWDGVTVDQYLRLGKASSALEQYAILLGVSLDELRDMDLTSFELSRQNIDNFIDTPVESVPVDSFELNGVKYVVAKNLEFEKVGPYSDWMRILSKIEDPAEFIPGSLAFFCRPKGQEYDLKGGKEREELFHGLPITTAQGIAAFFLMKREEYETNTASMIQMMMAPTWKQRSLINFWRVMDFMQRLFIWPAETFLKWIWYETSGWAMYLSSLAIRRLKAGQPK